MLRISWQTLRTRRATLAGAFVAIWLAVTLGYATGLLMDGALSPPGPGRFAAADLVVRADPSIKTADGETENAVPGPLLEASLVRRVAAVEGVARAYGDVAFVAGAPVLGEDVRGHAISGTTLLAGRAPRGVREVAATGPVALGERLRITTPAGAATYRVVGLARGEHAVYFADTTARRLAGTPAKVNAIVVNVTRGANPEQVRAHLATALAAAPAGGGETAPRIEVLDRAHAAEADAGDPGAADRQALVAIFGTMGGIAGAVALFVVAGTFTLAIVQRRREVAVLRALGAAPHQVRRLIAGEALIVSVVAGVLGILAGRPLARAIVATLADHGVVPRGFAPGTSWIPLVAALGGGILIAQIAVFAAARRAGRTRPAEALRDAVIERPRPGVLQIVAGLLCLGGGVAMALIFKGMWAVAFAILEGLLLACGVGLLGRALLGLPAALLARPLRAFGASGLLAGTSLAANRWRTAALATPIVLIAMLAGTQGVIESSGRANAERVTAARVTAPFVITGAPIPAETAARLKAEGVTAIAATQIYPDGPKLGEDAPWPAAGIKKRGEPALDLQVLAGDPSKGVAVSRVFAETGDLHVGDTFTARLADTSRHTLKVAAIYERAAGLGDVLLPGDVPAPTSAIFVRGERPKHTGLTVLTRDQYLRGVHAGGQEEAWGVWMIIGLAALFTVLALINTAAMATAERRTELATIRLLGGTTGQAIRTVALETLPTVLVALAAGAAVVAVSVHGVPSGLTGIPLTVPLTLIATISAGAAALGLLAALVTTRLALRTNAAHAMREPA